MNSYQEAINWLYNQLPNYQNQGLSAYKPGLERIRLLVDKWNNPQDSFKSIHVAGTNGKGSCSHMLASILQEQGYKVGLFTSPHFKNFTERIRINGMEASEAQVLQFIQKFQLLELEDDYSFFEISTLMAFEIFAQEKVDFAVIETGLGGRLDATNIITPLVSVITSISLDHTNILGESLSEIAYEKGGIIKEKVPVVLGEMPEEAENTLINISKQKNAKCYFSKEIEYTYPSDLKGAYQIKNQKTVLMCVQVIQNKGYTIDDKSIQNGLLNVRKNTSLRGRWEIVQINPTIIWDTAHNPEGIASAFAQITKESYDHIYAIMGFVEGKELDKIIDFLPKKNIKYYFVKPSNSRGLDPKKYEDKLIGFDYHIGENASKTYENIKQKLEPNDLLIVLGSNFLIADII